NIFDDHHSDIILSGRSSMPAEAMDLLARKLDLRLTKENLNMKVRGLMPLLLAQPRRNWTWRTCVRRRQRSSATTPSKLSARIPSSAPDLLLALTRCRI